MNFEDLQFKADDFLGSAIWDTDTKTATLVAERANRILAEKLSQAPEIWLEDEEMGFSETPWAWANRKARLVCIEEIKK